MEAEGDPAVMAHPIVIPAKAGIQRSRVPSPALDPRFRRGDDNLKKSGFILGGSTMVELE
jgi:hypothetical protein